MCFSIPYQVLDVTNNHAIIEGNRKIALGKEIHVKKGEYIQVLGSIAVGKLSKAEGLKIRKLVKSLNTGYIE
jgi:hydrogenase maturation factor